MDLRKGQPSTMVRMVPKLSPTDTLISLSQVWHNEITHFGRVAIMHPLQLPQSNFSK